MTYLKGFGVFMIQLQGFMTRQKGIWDNKRVLMTYLKKFMTVQKGYMTQQDDVDDELMTC